jgi:hypothetical protein
MSFKSWAVLAFCAAGLAPSARAQQTLKPDCVIDFIFTAAGQTQGGVGTCGNNQLGAVQWTLIYKSTGFSALSLRVESASDANGVPGAWGAFGGTIVAGINPNTATTQASTMLTGFFPWMRVSLTSVTGTGTITGELYGCRQPGCSGGFAKTTGTVTNIATGCGLSGGPITSTGTIISSWPRNAQTGTTYAIVAGDCGKQLTFSNVGAIAASIPQAGSAGFPNGWFTIIKNIGAADVTLTPATSTISGAASIVISDGEFCIVTSDGTNYEGDCNRLVQGANITLTKVRTGTTIAAAAGGVTNIATGCGLAGGPITTTGTIISSWTANAQTGATYAILAGDCGKQLTFANTLDVNVSIAQAGSAGFPNGYFTVVKNIGAGGGVGNVIITPTTSTINGAASQTLGVGEFCIITSNGTNYEADCNHLIPGANITLTKTNAGTTVAAAGSAAQQHVITFVITGAAGAAISTGDLSLFPTAAFSCTINRIDVSGAPSGSITVDIWKRAGAIPTAANKISASAPATLSSSQLNQNGSLTGWTTAVSSGDVFGGTVATAATVASVTVQVWCS